MPPQPPPPQPAPLTAEPLTPDRIAALFTRADGSFLLSRWGRPLAPVIFGLADESLAIFREVIRAVATDAGASLAETDPEMGADLMIFFCRDWAELDGLPDLDRLTGQPGLPARLTAGDADRYRLFRFDADGAIRACITFLRMGAALQDAHPAALAEQIAMGAMLTFAQEPTPSPALRDLIRAAYDPVLPAASTDASMALRLAARLRPG